MTTAERISKYSSIYGIISQAHLQSVKFTRKPSYFREYIFIDGSKLQIRFYYTDILTKVIK